MDYSGDSRVKKRKRAMIVTVAMQMFHKYGIADTSMLDVAKETKIGRSTFYEYFNSKEELVGYIRNIYLSELYSEVALPDKSVNGYEGVKQIMHKYMDVMLEHKDAVLFFFDYHRFIRAHDMPTSTVPDRIEELFDEVMMLVDRGHEDGSIKKDMNKRSFVIIWETIIGAATRHAVKYENRDDFKENFIVEDELHHLIDLLFSSVKA